MNVLLFSLDRRQFAIPASAAHAVTRAAAITPLPGAPAAVEGIVDVRGTFAPVYDLRQRFGIAPLPVDPAQHLVIADTATRRVAFRVDQVLGLSALSETEIQPIGHVLAGVQLVTGVAKLPRGIVLIHDLDCFLDHDDLILLNETMGAFESASAADSPR